METCSCHGNDECIPSFIFMHATVSKLRRGYLLLYVVVMETCSCHGNDVICMRTKFHFYVLP